MSTKRTQMGLSDYSVRLMLALISSTMILLILFTTLLYHDFRTVASNVIEEQERSAVKRSAHSVTEMTAIADLVARQLRANPSVSAMLSGESAVDSVSFFLPSDDSAHTAFIDSICFLSLSGESVYMYDEGVVTQMPASALPDLSRLPRPAPGESVGPTIRSYQSTSGKSVQSITYLYGDKSGTIIMNVSPAWLNEKIGAYQEGGSRTFTVSADGTPLEGASVVGETEDDAFITVVTASEKESNTLLLREGGVKYYVSYVKTPEITYIRVRPYAATQNYNYRFYFILLLSFFLILGIGLVLAYFFTRRLSKPVHRMANKLERLENRNAVSLRALKQDFLSSLLVSSRISAREIGTKFADCKVNIPEHAPLFMILLTFDRWRDLCAKNSYADRNLLKYGLMNIAEELVSERFVCDLVDDAEDSVVILCRYPSPASTKEEINSILTTLNQALTTHLDFSVTACVGNTVTDITEVSALYHTVKRTAEYRLYYGHGSIIYSAELPVLPKEPYNYPSGKEKQLIDAMMLSKPDRCIELLNEFIAGVRPFSPETARGAVSRLSMAVNMAFSGDTVHGDYIAESERLLIFVQGAETLSEIATRYEEFFRHLADSKSDQKSKKYDDLISRIHARIESDFADPNLSVNSIAEEEHRSPVYLGRLYKSRTGHSISEYINEVRIKEAKRLLSETNLTVNEIVERIGFSGSSYFYTVFKKHQGIAPNDYRQKQKKQDED